MCGPFPFPGCGTELGACSGKDVTKLFLMLLPVAAERTPLRLTFKRMVKPSALKSETLSCPSLLERKDRKNQKDNAELWETIEF